jgi:hypothetical protein
MSSEQRPWFRSRSGAVFLGFIAIAAFFLWEEHKAHILGILPYVLFLLCPLLHLLHGDMELIAVNMSAAAEVTKK